MAYQTIKDWPQEDRPREKLLANGAHSLSETELLAIILRNGNASTGESAIDHARLLLNQFGGLKGIDDASTSEICLVKGIGPAKVAQLKACLEIGKRVGRSEEHTSELQSQSNLVCRLLLEKKKQTRG